MKKKISFIGSGKMAQALIGGVIKAGLFPPKNIFISDLATSRLNYLSKKYKANKCPDNISAVKISDIVILSVKPKDINLVLSEIKHDVKKKQLFISIAAGIRIKTLEKHLNNSIVVRAMPNTPALLGHGSTAISKGSKAKKTDLKTAIDIFESVGHVIVVEEKMMDAVTAVSGSGPAFVYSFVRGMVNAGVKAGLDPKTAKDLVIKTLIGAGHMLKDLDKSADELISMVASPGGTTVAGLSKLDESKFEEAVGSAIIAAYKRSIEISKEFEAN